MTNKNKLSLKAGSKLLKKVIQNNLFAQGISISSRSSEKEFRFWLQKISISLYANGGLLSAALRERKQIERKGNSLAEQIIQLCQQQQTLSLDKTVINSLKGSLNLSESEAEVAEEAPTSIDTTEAELEPTLAEEASTSIETTETQAEPASVEQATETLPPTSTTQSLSNLPSEFLELLNENLEPAFEPAWTTFDEQLREEPSLKLASEEILGNSSSEELVFIARGERGLAIANQNNQPLDYAVAQMPALNVGSYRELQSGQVIHVGYGDDGNKYITQWGSENRGGIQIAAKTILLLVRA